MLSKPKLELKIEQQRPYMNGNFRNGMKKKRGKKIENILPVRIQWKKSRALSLFLLFCLGFFFFLRFFFFFLFSKWMNERWFIWFYTLDLRCFYVRRSIRTYRPYVHTYAMHTAHMRQRQIVINGFDFFFPVITRIFQNDLFSVSILQKMIILVF